MSIVNPGALSFDSDPENEADITDDPKARDTTPGGQKETKWVVVTETAGLMPAEIIAQRLEAEGIPSRAWQEGAGQAFGLTVGLLGTGYVMVPEAYEERAKEILDSTPDEGDLDDQSASDDQD